MILLATFVAGGIVAPMLHEARHVLEQSRKVEATARAHAGHAHSDGVSLETTVDVGAKHAFCVLCTFRWSSEVSGSSDPIRNEVVSLVVPASEGISSRFVEHISIRGPPALA